MRNFAIAALSASALGLAACADTEPTDVTAEGDEMMADQMANADQNSIVDLAQGDANLSTLVTAINAAGLGDTLSSGGPYTVFAPTNDAFAKLPDGTVENLTTEDTDQLGTILQYHVVDGEVMSGTLLEAIEAAGADGYTINTLGGGELTATMEGGNVILTDATGSTATVTGTDIDASNGVVHTIDTVLMPG